MHDSGNAVPSQAMNATAAPLKDRTFTFRPAARRRPQRWSLQGDRLTGPGGSIILHSIRRTRLVQLRSGSTRLMRFDMETGAQVARVEISTTARTRSGDADQQAYLDLLSTIAQRLAELKPGLTYRMEETGRARIAVFMLGAAALVTGIALMLVLSLGLHSFRNEVLMAMPVLLGMVVAGAVVSCRFWPFRRPDEFPIATLPFILWTMGGPRPATLPEGWTEGRAATELAPVRPRRERQREPQR